MDNKRCLKTGYQPVASYILLGVLFFPIHLYFTLTMLSPESPKAQTSMLFFLLAGTQDQKVIGLVIHQPTLTSHSA